MNIQKTSELITKKGCLVYPQTRQKETNQDSKDFTTKSLNDFFSIFSCKEISGKFNSHISLKGDEGLLKTPLVSIVGTRNPSESGKKQARYFAKIACNQGFSVVSGLAKGIDTEAHKATLEANGKTIAVLGTYINNIYPKQNKDLAETIIRKGLLLSNTEKNESGKHVFPRRNEIMAIMSKATIVIEAGETSGVIHQCAECLRQGKRLILSKILVKSNYKWVKDFSKNAIIVNNEQDLIKALKFD